MDIKKYEHRYLAINPNGMRYKMANDILKTPTFIAYKPLEAKYKGILVDDLKALFYLDVYARYLRLNNYNVLFKLMVNNLKVLGKDREVVFNSNRDDLLSFDLSVFKDDYLEANSKDYLGFVQNIFVKLYQSNLVKKLKKKVIYSDTKIYQDGEYEKVDNKYYDGYKELSQKEEENYYIDLHDLKVDIINDLNNLSIDNKTELMNKFGYHSYIKMKFYNSEMQVVELDLDNPEYLYGVSFIIINPKLFDLDQLGISVDPNVASGVNLSYSGIELLNPLNNYKIPVYLSAYQTEKIHFGIPSLNLEDEEFIEKNNLPYFPIFDYVNEQRVLVNSGLLNGYYEYDAHDYIIEVLSNMDLCEVSNDIDLRYLLISTKKSNERPIPLYKDNSIPVIPVHYNSETDKFYHYKEMLENPLVTYFFNDSFFNSFALNSMQIDGDLANTKLDDFYAYQDVKKHNELELYVFDSVDSLYYQIIANALVRFSYGSDYNIKINNYKYIPKDSKEIYVPRDFSIASIRLSLLKNCAIKEHEEELDYIVEALTMIKLEDDLNEEFADLKDTLNFDIKAFNYEKYYLDILSFIDVILQKGGIEIKKARRLLVYLYVILPTLASYIAKEKLNIKNDLDDYSW